MFYLKRQYTAHSTVYL